MNKIKPLLINVSLVFFSLFLVLAVLEVGLRLTVYNFKPYAKSPGPNAVYHIETEEYKTAIRTNSLNMRDAEILPKTPGQYRVLCLGDSFTFGMGVNVPEAYPKIAEKILKGRGFDVNVINGGTQGNVKDATKFFLETGASFHPDLVVEQVYIGNDFYDWLRSDEPMPKNLPAARKSFLGALLSSAKKTVRNFHLRTFDFLWTRLIQFPYIDDVLFRLNLRYDNQGIFLRKYPTLERRLAADEFRGLLRLKRLCDERGIAFAVLIAPSQQQVFKKKLLEDDKYFYGKPNRLIGNFCRVNDVPCIDMLGVYETVPARELKNFYYVRDQHWTVKGHAFTGQVLADVIERKMKLPAASGAYRALSVGVRPDGTEKPAGPAFPDLKAGRAPITVQ